MSTNSVWWSLICTEQPVDATQGWKTMSPLMHISLLKTTLNLFWLALVVKFDHLIFLQRCMSCSCLYIITYCVKVINFLTCFVLSDQQQNPPKDIQCMMIETKENKWSLTFILSKSCFMSLWSYFKNCLPNWAGFCRFKKTNLQGLETCLRW